MTAECLAKPVAAHHIETCPLNEEAPSAEGADGVAVILAGHSAGGHKHDSCTCL